MKGGFTMSVIPFCRRHSDGNEMAKRSQAKIEEPAEADRPTQDPDKAIERRSIALPAYIWRIIEKEAEDELRTLSRQIELIMLNYYQLGSRKIEPSNKMEPGSYGFVGLEKAS
jgi:hypothetical protein